jgi:hypothetical protein
MREVWCEWIKKSEDRTTPKKTPNTHGGVHTQWESSPPPRAPIIIFLAFWHEILKGIGKTRHPPLGIPNILVILFQVVVFVFSLVAWHLRGCPWIIRRWRLGRRVLGGRGTGIRHEGSLGVLGLGGGIGASQTLIAFLLALDIGGFGRGKQYIIVPLDGVIILMAIIGAITIIGLITWLSVQVERERESKGITIKTKKKPLAFRNPRQHLKNTLTGRDVFVPSQ